MTIGGIEAGKLVLGPMAGVTDTSYRGICREHGADMVYTEMVSAKGIYYNSKNTEALLETSEAERPVALQLFGENAQIMSEMAKRIEERPFDFLDINMGCPVPKVVGNGEGSALMKDPKKAGEIVRAVSRAIKKPVIVKIRKGFDENNINAVEVARILEDAGAKAVAVHGRTREQYYSGKADIDIIRRVKEALQIPVIGNGDVFTPQDAKLMLEQTGCDAVMVARGARGNPWIFEQIKVYLETGQILQRPDVSEIFDMLREHARRLIESKGEFTAMREIRKHVAWYTAGLPNSAKLREMANFVENYEKLKELLSNYEEGRLAYEY